MAAKPHLRPVGDNEPAPKRKTVAEAAKSGTKRELLVALRDRLAEAITKPDCPFRELSALTTRLQSVVDSLEQLDLSGDGEQSVVADTDDEPFDATSV